MSQADGVSELKRISLNLKTGDEDRWYNFKINPENYEENYPQRTNVFRTREAVVVEDFGPDVASIKFSGTTGFRILQDDKIEGNRVMNGAARLFRLEKLIKDYALSGKTSEPGANPNNAQLIFHNNTDGKSWYVHLADEGFSITRSVEESMLYRYTINLIILRDTTTPLDREIDNADIGNPINNEIYQPPRVVGNESDAKNPRSSHEFYLEYLKRNKQLIGLESIEGPYGTDRPLEF